VVKDEDHKRKDGRIDSAEKVNSKEMIGNERHCWKDQGA